MSGKDKKTIGELLDSLCSKNLRGPFLKALAESVGASSSAAHRYLAKHGNLPAPTVSDITKLMLANPEVSKAMEMCPAGSGGMLTSVASPGCVEVFGAIPIGDQTATKKRKKKNKKKKSVIYAEDPPELIAQKGLGGVLRPRNFLEAALYFSSITMGTIEMATTLDPEYFFAPPILFSASPLNTFEWIGAFQKANCSVFEWEQHKAVQRRVVGLLAVAVLQTTNPNVKIGDKGSSISVRSNYLKRTIGLYAISLVDHLPPTLSTGGENSGGGRGGGGGGGMSTLSHFAPQRGASPILLANRKVDLNDLKVPTAHQLTQFWESLSSPDRLNILRSEQTTLQKGWISLKKTWCLCKYCRTRSIRLVDVYEVLYRSYYDDLERMAADLDPKRQANLETATTLKAKARRNLYRQLSELADDIVDERGCHYQMVMRRLGKAFEEDYDWDDCDHSDETCDSCRKRYLGKYISAADKPNKGSPSLPSLPLKDEYSDEDDELHSDEWDEEDLESFYEDFNLMEDEDIILTESELPIDPLHLSTSFPQLYDPRLYTMPRPAVPAYNHTKDEAERMSDGLALYERFASLLFQFHLVPKYLEAEALARQKRLLEEEEEKERLEKERFEQRQLAKQRKKERQRAAKQKLVEEPTAALVTTLAAASTLVTSQSSSVEMVKVVVHGKVKTDAIEFNRDLITNGDVGPVVGEVINQSGHDMVEGLVGGLEHNLTGDNDPYGRIADGTSITSTTVGESLVSVGNINEEEDGEGDEKEETPPGLSTSADSNVITQELTGEAPPEVPSTWFDKILRGPIADVSIESLWSPVATNIKMLHDEVPPGFSPALGLATWSPFSQ